MFKDCVWLCAEVLTSGSQSRLHTEQATTQHIPAHGHHKIFTDGKQMTVIKMRQINTKQTRI